MNVPCSALYYLLMLKLQYVDDPCSVWWKVFNFFHNVFMHFYAHICGKKIFIYIYALFALSATFLICISDFIFSGFISSQSHQSHWKEVSCEICVIYTKALGCYTTYSMHFLLIPNLLNIIIAVVLFVREVRSVHKPRHRKKKRKKFPRLVCREKLIL